MVRVSVVTDLSVAVLLGGLLAAGLLLALSVMPRWGVKPLAVRIAPYVRHAVTEDRMPAGTVTAVGILPAGGLARARSMLRVGANGDGAVGIRLTQAGLDPDVDRFRVNRLAYALAGFGLGAALVVILAVATRLSPPAVLLPLLGAVAGAMVCDARLTTRARARLRRIEEEIPTTLEFLALCLAAGEGLFDALRRVAAVGSGELTAEIRLVVASVQTGSPLAAALSEAARRLSSPVVSRAIDQIISALERGSPVADVLQAQAADAREEAKRSLLERAGRNEISMMIPVVFGLLPLSVLFALLPGILLLRLGLG